MIKNMKNSKIYWMLALMVLMIATRLIPHPFNFSPLGGVALFSAAVMGRKWVAFAIPFLLFLVSDLAINTLVYANEYSIFYEGWYFQYIAYGLIIFVGSGLFQKLNLGRILGGALMASVIFFLVSNFGSWVSLPMYSKDWVGLQAAFIAGLPFLKNTVTSNILYTCLLFGSAFYFGVLSKKAALQKS